MANQDNPIFDTLNRKLGLEDGPKSFQEKYDIFRSNLLENKLIKESQLIEGQVPEEIVFRKMGKASALGGAERYTGAKGASELFDKLSKNGLVPNSDKTTFEGLKTLGKQGALFYTPESRSLFFARGMEFEALPLPRANVGGTLAASPIIGGKLRKAAPFMAGPGESITYAERFYQGITEQEGRVSFQELRKTLGAEGIFAEAGITQGGFRRAEEMFFTEQRPIIQPKGFGIQTQLAEDYRAGFNILTKTAGALVGPLERYRDVGVESALASLQTGRREFFGQVAQAFEQSAAGPSSFVFVKPEYIGGSKAMKMAAPIMSQIYGTQFEAQTLSKGLFQLAKSDLAPETSKYRSPYAIAGQFQDFTSRIQTGMRVGVVDTRTQGQLLNLFGEGGALFTPEGAEKFARQLPAGSLYISGPTGETIGNLEKLFGLNLGAGDVQVFDDPKALIAGGSREARRQVEGQLGRQAGFMRTLATEYGSKIGLSKIERTDVGLRLDFATRGAVTPETAEMLIGARRHSGVLVGKSHPLHGLLNSSALRNLGVDALVSADEYQKMLGPQVYVTNYIEQVSQRADAAEIFENVFGHSGWKKGDQVLFNYDFDSAFERARRSVPYLRGLGEDSATKLSGTELVRRIRQGESLDLAGKQIDKGLGITGVRVFGMAGSFRTDFMGDINMMNPLRMTASKMVTLASGYQSLGYGTALDDPLVDLLSRSSKDWRGKGANFSIDPDTGRLKIGRNNLVRRFAEIVSGVGTLSAEEKATFSSVNAIIGKDGLRIQGKKLNLLPDLQQFAFSEGGLPLTQLDGTILDPKREMAYIDLGKKVDLNIAGRKVAMQQLPIPVGLLRKAKGPYDRIVMGADDPAFGLVSAVREIEQALDFDNLVPGEKGADRLTPKALEKLGASYTSIIQSLVGKEGLAETASSIMLYGGTRARLAPSKTDLFFGERRPRIEQMLTAEVSGTELHDFFKRKAATIKSTGDPGDIRGQFDYIRNQLKSGNKDIYVMLSADPAQRAEHFQVMKLHVTGDLRPGKVTQKLGQLNVSVSPMWMKLMERDLDRDVVNFLPLSGMNVEGRTQEEIQKALADRYDRQSKLLKHYVHLYGAELDEVADEKLTARRLGGKLRAGLIAGKEAIKNLGSTLMGYEGGQKSAGYTIARSGEDLMVTLAGRVSKLRGEEGIEGALRGAVTELGGADLGALESSMFSKFVGETGERRLSASRQALQALYQGAVQKAGEKGGLEELGSTIAQIGEDLTQRRAAFDYEKSLGRIQTDVEAIIQQQAESGKLRGFYDIEFLGSENQTIGRVLADLERGAADAAEVTAAKGQIIKGQAKLIAEFLLPGIIARKTTGGAKGIAEDIVRGVPGEDQEYMFSKLLRGLGIGTSGGIEEATQITDEALETAEKSALKGAEAAKGAFGSFLDFMSSSRGKAFAGGIGVGVIAATAVRSMVSDEAPMPRDIDTRQPMDQGPDIFTSAPRIYGSSSPMHASRGRNPVSPTSIDGYSMYSSPSPHISISDKRSAFDPHLIDSHMRAVAHSDYSY